MNSIDIALVGLPSAGKSSIINSLVGKRVAQSGATRTTREAKLYSDLTSDDGIKYNIYDLPGIADIDDQENKFDTIIFSTIKKSNLVLWVSDISKSFITNHEMKEFEKVRAYINQLGKTEGLPIKLAILLSKADKQVELLNVKPATSLESVQEAIQEAVQEVKQEPELETKQEQEIMPEQEIKQEPEPEPEPEIKPEPVQEEILEPAKELDEIVDEEDTSISNIYTNIMGKFSDISVLCFNAYGRALHHPSVSETLRAFVLKNNPTISNANITFNLKSHSEHIHLTSDKVKLDFLLNNKLKTLVSSLSKSCGTLNVKLPENVVLWCYGNDCPVSECVGCDECNNSKYDFRCAKHLSELHYCTMKKKCNDDCESDTRYNNLNTSKTSEGYHVNKCSNSDHKDRCQIDFVLEPVKITCAHSNNISKCNSLIDWAQFNSEISTQIQQVYEGLDYADNKVKLIELLLLDEAKPGELTQLYNPNIWNMICKNIKIDISQYYKWESEVSTLTPNQIFRLISMDTSLDLSKKLYLYTLDNFSSVSLPDGTSLNKGPIYNLDDYLSGRMFVPSDKPLPRNLYEREIYSTLLQSKVRQIRFEVFGDKEYDIHPNMIPLAYEKYGLFWCPVNLNWF